MSLRRLSSLAIGRRAAAALDQGAKLAEALDLALIVDPLETMDAHDCARFFILGANQTFKSLAGQLRLARNHRVRPRPALWYAPTDDFLRDFADTKLNPLLEAVPCTRDLHYGEKSRVSDTFKFDRTRAGKFRRTLTGGATHLLLSASTANDRVGKTACDLYLDEVHLYEDGAIAEIQNRKNAYIDEFTETFMSTGLFHGSEAHKVWETTDQRVWHWRCPACRRLFEPRLLHYRDGDTATKEIIGGLRYERRALPDGLPDINAIAATIHYECPHCRAHFPDTHGSRVQLSGTAANPRGLYIATNPHAEPRCFGWTFNALAVRGWLAVAKRFELAQYARSRGDLAPLGSCLRDDFGAIWAEHDHIKEARLRPPGGYKLGDPWPAENKDPNGDPYRIASVDVQQDHFVLVIRAWNRRSQSRLIFADKPTTASRLHDLIREHGVIASRVVLDRRHSPQRVRHLCAQHGWRSLMGESDKDYLHPDGIRRIFSPPASIDPFQGTMHQGRSLVVENNFAKWSALDRLALLRTLETHDGLPLFTAADDAPAWYFKELDAYYRIRKTRATGEFHEWTSGGRPDHAADCECMGIAVASALGLTGSDSLTPPPTAEKSPA